MFKWLLWPVAWLPWRLMLSLAVLFGGAWLGVRAGWWSWQDFLPGAAVADELPAGPGLDWRLLFNHGALWLLANALLPFLLWPLTLAGLRRQSNSVNLLLLGAYSLILVAAGVWLLWPLVERVGWAALMVLLLLISAVLQYMICALMDNYWA